MRRSNAAATKILVETMTLGGDPLSIAYSEQILALQTFGVRVLKSACAPLATHDQALADLAFSQEQQRDLAEIPIQGEVSVHCAYRIHRFDDSAWLRAGGTISLAPKDGSEQPNPFCYKLSTSNGDVVVASSQWSRKQIIDAGGVPENIVVIPHGVDTMLFAPLSLDERAATRAMFKVLDEEIVFLNIASDAFRGGVDVLLKAFVALHVAGLPVRLVLKHENLAMQANYETTLRDLVGDLSELHHAGILAAITIVSQGIARSQMRLVYGMADFYVSPCRADHFNMPALEAIAVGTPVIVAAGGAGDDVCDDDVAWRIASDLRRSPDPETGALRQWLEPNYLDLANAMTEVARGRGFDRLRFARARVQILARFSWQQSAARLIALANNADHVDTPPVKASVSGLAQPLDVRFASTRHADLPKGRSFKQNRIRHADGNCLSVIVQGPCIRVRDGKGAPSTDETLASIRQNFPGAQIVLSTWMGSDIDGLDADDIVLSRDPGSLDHAMHLPNNVNRMVTSTVNGLAAATRPYCIKTRNDVLFRSDALACKELRPAATPLSLDRRIWVSAARLETSLRPFHPCDMVQYGLTCDLLRLWDVPVVKFDDAFLSGALEHVPREAPEQSVFIGYLRNVGIDVRLDHTFDGRYEIIASSLETMLGAFDVFDAETEGVVLSPRFRDNARRPRLYETHESFEALRAEYRADRKATIERIYRSCHETLQALNRAS